MKNSTELEKKNRKILHTKWIAIYSIESIYTDCRCRQVRASTCPRRVERL